MFEWLFGKPAKYKVRMKVIKGKPTIVNFTMVLPEVFEVKVEVQPGGHCLAEVKEELIKRLNVEYGNDHYDIEFLSYCQIQ